MGTNLLCNFSYLDVNDHQFRLKVVCILLATCGMYMKSGSSKKKIDYFLGYYQLYYWRVRGLYDTSGDVDLFREITQIINDTFSTVNSTLKLCKSIEEAEKMVKAGEEEIMKTLKSKAPQLLQSIGIGQSGDSNDALHTITEEEDGEEMAKPEKLYHENHGNVDNESLVDSASDDEAEENEIEGEGDDETDTEDEESAEEHEYGDEIMDTDDDESERKEVEREMEGWSVKPKPKLIGE